MILKISSSKLIFIETGEIIIISFSNKIHRRTIFPKFIMRKLIEINMLRKFNNKLTIKANFLTFMKSTKTKIEDLKV